MSKSSAPLPVARTWRDISQQVKPRAMSREGRRRLTWRGVRLLVALAAIAGAVGAGWQISGALRTGHGFLAAARPEAIGSHVEPLTDGVLDRAWVVRTLALRPGATLASIDPAALRARLLAGGQVQAADIERDFPHTLAVHLSERTPIARVMLAAGQGAPQALLVARDGVVYQGRGYSSTMIATLPWLDGVAPKAGGPGVATIAGMPVAAEFLARAELDAQHLYRHWRVVSLARLLSDGLIEVRTDQGTSILFATRTEDEFPQLARLDTILDSVGSRPVERIDLSLGPSVPVAIRPVAPATSLQ